MKYQASPPPFPRRTAVLLAVGLLAAGCLASRASAGKLGPFDVLERVRVAYGALQSYEDSGSILVDGTLRWGFSTSYDAAVGYLLRLDDAATGEPVSLFWSSEDGAFRYEASTDEGQPVSYLLSEILGRVGSGGRLGLVPTVLLLQGPVGLPEPEAASLDGPIPCAEMGAEADAERAPVGDCYLVSGGALGGTVGFELWVGADDFRVLAADVEAVGVAQLAPGESTQARRLRVTYETARFDDPSIDLRLPAPIEPGDDRDLVASDRPPADEGDYVFDDTVEVRLSTLTMRAIDPRGTTIADLRPSDLLLLVDGEEVGVEAVEWVESAVPQVELPPEVLAREGIVVAPPGKLVVIFVQADLEASRAYGQMRLMPRVKELLDGLGRDDWVAVVSFDSHLKLRHDFSRDRESVHAAVKTAITYTQAERLTAGRFPSLARFLDYDEARDVANPEEALAVTASALHSLPGEKVMLFLGFGLGRFFGGDVLLGGRYDRAAERLAAARVSVFTLDVSQADAHSLEVGLKQVSADTGGAYFRTFRNPDRALRQVAQAIAGHYLVYFYPPGSDAASDERPRRRKEQRVKLRLRERKGSILLSPQG